MNVAEVKDWIAAGKLDLVESAWAQAVEQAAPVADMLAVLEALVAGRHLKDAEMLGWSLVAERAEKAAPADALAVAKAVVLAVPDSADLRQEAAALYHKALGGVPNLDALLKASGLTEGRSARWALRTLDVCLGMQLGAFLVNRIEHGVVRVERFDPAAGKYEVAHPDGTTATLDATILADDFDPIDPDDFRVLAQFQAAQLPL